jgi:hypothetical protein
MIDQTPRDPWRVLWQVAAGDHLLAFLLLGVAAGLAITTRLPQMPAADPMAYARWLSEAQARFGQAAPTLQTLGLFTVTRSLGFRALLALLGGCLLLRLIETVDRLRQYREIAEPGAAWPWADLFPILAHGGALLLLTGLLIAHLWGWRVEGLIVQSGQRVTLAGTDRWVALDAHGERATHSPGVVTYVEEWGPGVQAAAADAAGRSLSFRQTAEAGPVTQLTAPLTEDQYVAIPEAQLILRLTPQPEQPLGAHTPVLIQVYTSPAGRLTAETVMTGDTRLTVGDVKLEFASAPYARLTAAFNPGLWPTAAGLASLVAGVLGGAAWSARQLWLWGETERAAGIRVPSPPSSRGREA